MARPATTLAQRAANVRSAVADLPAAIERATAASASYGDADARTLAAWTIVETHGATVHRNGRLLAGKRKGG